MTNISVGHKQNMKYRIAKNKPVSNVAAGFRKWFVVIKYVSAE